jgi:SAM-dependent methyltransferase
MNRAHIEFLSSPQWAEMLRSDLLPWLTSVGPLGDDIVEIGPGPGLTTDLLRERAARVTAIEVDSRLAGRLAERLVGTNVEVLEGDATDTVLESDRFSAVTCFSVLHHISTPQDQDRLFAEISRLLRPGGLFVGVDARDLEQLRQAHDDDTFTPVPRETLPGRLKAARLEIVDVDEDEYQIRFVARKPA